MTESKTAWNESQFPECNIEIPFGFTRLQESNTFFKKWTELIQQPTTNWQTLFHVSFSKGFA